MTRRIDVYLGLRSPWTYLAMPRLLAMIAEAGARATFKPVDLGAVFAVSGGLPLPQRSLQRQAYRLQELERWRSRLGMPLLIAPKHFGADEKLAARVVIAHRSAGGDAGILCQAILTALWTEDADISDKTVLAGILARLGLDGDSLLAAADAGPAEAAYAADTAEAIERGVFGAPFMIVGEQMFWGQDRLDFVREALLA